MLRALQAQLNAARHEADARQATGSAWQSGHELGGGRGGAGGHLDGLREALAAGLGLPISPGSPERCAPQPDSAAGWAGGGREDADAPDLEKAAESAAARERAAQEARNARVLELLRSKVGNACCHQSSHLSKQKRSWLGW